MKNQPHGEHIPKNEDISSVVFDGISTSISFAISIRHLII